MCGEFGEVTVIIGLVINFMAFVSPLFVFRDTSSYVTFNDKNVNDDENDFDDVDEDEGAQARGEVVELGGLLSNREPALKVNIILFMIVNYKSHSPSPHWKEEKRFVTKSPVIDSLKDSLSSQGD